MNHFSDAIFEDLFIIDILEALKTEQIDAIYNTIMKLKADGGNE